MNCQECTHSTHRTKEEKAYLETRLKTIEGQVRGVAKMIEEDKYCNDVLVQLLAINKSLRSISNDILKNHLSTCVVNKIKDGDTTVVDEVMKLVSRLN